MIPEDIAEKMPGVMVTVQFGRGQLYSGIVCSVHDNKPGVENIKPIISVTTETPVINESQLRLWLWISEYYLCSEGEVMKAALPSEISLNNYRPRLDTFIKLAGKYSEDELNEMLDKLKKAPRQQDVLFAYLRITGYTTGKEIAPVSKSLLLSESHSSSGIIDVLAQGNTVISIASGFQNT